MKKTIFALSLCAVMILLSACGKSQAVKDVEKAISEIGEVTVEKKAVIQQANEAYEALSDKEKTDVENYSILIETNDKLYRAEYYELANELLSIGYRTDKSVNVIQYVWNNVGASDFWTFFDNVVFFKKMEQLDGLITLDAMDGGHTWEIMVWGAGVAFNGKSFDIDDLSTTGNGRQLAEEIVDLCVKFNENYTDLDKDCQEVGERIREFKNSYSDKNAKEIETLQDWFIELSLYVDLAIKPTGTLNNYKSDCNAYHNSIERYIKTADSYY